MKVLAVTGGAQGIGRAVTFHFAKAGYAVSSADVEEDAGEEALRKVNELGAKGMFVRTGACLFLSKSAGFMTGQNLIIDGGMTIKMIYEEQNGHALLS